MRRLVLVRHSLPQIVPGLPASQWVLSEEGRCRCRLLAEALAAFQPDVVVSSHEAKAVETGRLIAAELDKPFETADGLHEHERSNVPYCDRERFEAAVAEFFARPDELVFGDETAQQALGRFSQAIHATVSRHLPRHARRRHTRRQTIAVVTHGTVMTLFVAHIAGVEPFSFWQGLGLPAFVVLALPEFELLNVTNSIA